jgi:pectinesterase
VYREVVHVDKPKSNTRPGQDAGYVFNHCKITADQGAGDVYLGRPWRDYSTVIFMNTKIEAPIMAAGWSEWKDAPQPRLPMATYAEFHSMGRERIRRRGSRIRNT